MLCIIIFTRKSVKDGKLTLISLHSKFIFMFYNIFPKNNRGAPYGTPPSLSCFDFPRRF